MNNVQGVHYPECKSEVFSQLSKEFWSEFVEASFSCELDTVIVGYQVKVTAWVEGGPNSKNGKQLDNENLFKGAFECHSIIFSLLLVQEIKI